MSFQMFGRSAVIRLQHDVTEVYSPRNAWGVGQRVVDEFPPMHAKALRLQWHRATDAEM
jgi:hypothetical protein